MHRVDPSRASAGDRVVLTGEGFPEGRPATVTFRGDLVRPGVPAERDVRIVAPALPTARDAVSITFDRAIERKFVGSGTSAVHTTFHGDVRVVFQPGKAGLAPVAGTAHDVRFDVLPAQVERADETGAESVRALSILGMAVAPDPSLRGVQVSAVEPDGRAALAGLAAGDVILDLDGVSTLSPDDLRARGGQRIATLLVERAGRVLPPLPLDVEGLSPLGAADAVSAAWLLLLGCVFLALPATRFGLVLRWLARVAELRRARQRPTRSDGPGALHDLLDSLLPDAAHGRALVSASLVVLAAVVVGFSWLAFEHSLLSPDLDLAVAGLGVTFALVATRFVHGGARPSGGFSLWGALSAAGRSLACVVPALGALAGAVVASGRFVIAEMVAEQGGVPWRWAGMRNPGLALLFVVLVASTLPEAGAASALGPAEGLAEPPQRRASTARALLWLAEWSFLWITCGLAVALFLGGWRVPGQSSMAQEASRMWTSVGALLFLLKLWGLVLMVGSLRRATGRLAVEHVGALALRWAVPGTALSFALALGWTAALDGARSELAADLVGYTAVALVLSVATALAFTALSRQRLASTASVNPWL